SAKLTAGYTYLDKLVVLSIDPPTGPAAGQIIVTIRGHGFMSGAQVKVGDVSATNVTVANDHSFITATLPAHAAGQTNVVVTNPDGKAFTLKGGFTYTQ